MVNSITAQQSLTYMLQGIDKNKVVQTSSLSNNGYEAMNKLPGQLDEYFYTNESNDYYERNFEKYFESLDLEEINFDEYIDKQKELSDLTLGQLGERIESFTKSKEREGQNAEEALQYFGNQVERLKQHEESMYIYAMKHEGELTINDLYKGSYSESATGSGVTYTSSDISSILKSYQLEENTGNVEAVSKLLDLGVDISKSSLLKIQNVQTAVEQLEMKKELDEAEEELRGDKALGERVLLKDDKILYTEKDIKDIVEELSEISREDIGNKLLSKEEMNIGNLRKKMDDNVKKLNEVAPEHTGQKKSLLEGSNDVMDSDENIEEIELQIKEIRGKLTQEAAIKISEKMPLESTEISKVVEALRTIEEAQIDEAIKQVGLENIEESKEEILKVMDAKVHIDRSREHVISLELEEPELSVEKLHQSLIKYEESGTEVERRFGESVASVEEQIPATLERLEIEATNENYEITKALITQQIEITSENIEEARIVNENINTVLKNLSPKMMCEMIKEGISPYNSSLKVLTELTYDRQVEEVKESIAEAIVGLESEKEINEAQKKSLVGFYRIVDTVSKNKEEVVGYLYKNKLPLTIKHLEEAIKYVNPKRKMDVKIDDAFGELEKLKFEKQTSKMLMEVEQELGKEAVEKMNELEHKPLEFKILQGNLYSFVKEHMKQELGKFEGKASLAPSLKEKIEVANEVEVEILEEMKEKKIPLTLSNVYWYKKMLDNPKVYGELLQDMNLGLKVKGGSLEAFERKIESIQQEAVQAKENAVKEGDLKEYKKYKQIEEASQFKREKISREGHYEIPFEVNGKLKIVDLYVNGKGKKRNAQGEMKLLMTYHTDELGEIKTYITLKDDRINYEIVGRSSDVTGRLSNHQQKLRGLIEQVGYSLAKANYSIAKKDEKQSIKIKQSEFEEVI